jgi:GAF domain-containing protein
MVSPYPCAGAAVPLLTGSTAWGVMFTLSPQGRSALDLPTRRLLTTTGQCIAWILQGAADAGRRLRPGPEPRFLPLPSPQPAASSQAQAAVDFLTSLPEGSCRLDPRGRITFADPTAASLLGESRPRLMGARLWEAVPWLAHPALEDRYQAITLTDEEQGPGEPDLLGPGAVTGPRLDALHHLMHLSGALAEAASVRQVVDLVAGHLLLALQAQAFALLVSEAGRIRVVGHRGFPPALVQLLDHAPLASDVPVPGLTTGAPAWELSHGVPSFFADREELRTVYPAGADAGEGIDAWAWLPLMVAGQLIGICAIGYTRPHPFPLEERTVLTSVGALIAQALERARQYDATHQLAEGLQARLLPRELPTILGLETAARYVPTGGGLQVGGDWYDVIPLPTGRFALVIGDVQGHDVSAAGLMGQVRTAVHAYAVSGATPGEVLARTNHLLIDLDPDLLTSCLYVHLDLVHHRAHLATAGHCQPLLRHPDRRSEILDLPPGPLLGVAPEAHYPITELTVPTGTILALYTDGLIETPGTDHDTNITKLTAVLSDTGGPLDSLADTLLTHAQPSGDRADDTALLLLHIAPQPGPPKD